MLLELEPGTKCKRSIDLSTNSARKRSSVQGTEPAHARQPLPPSTDVNVVVHSWPHPSTVHLNLDSAFDFPPYSTISIFLPQRRSTASSNVTRIVPAHAGHPEPHVMAFTVVLHVWPHTVHSKSESAEHLPPYRNRVIPRPLTLSRASS